MPLLSRLLPRYSNRPVALGFGAALSLLAIGFGLSFYNYGRYNTANERVEHTYRVIGTLNEVLSLMKDVEIGVRGYVISGDDLFLEPYALANRQLPGQLRELQKLVTDNAEQRQRTDTLIQLINAKLVLSQRQLATRRQQKRIEPEYLLVSKRHIDQIRRQITRMTASEHQLMQTRNSGVSHSFWLILLLTLALSILTFATLIFSYNLLETERIRRQQNEHKLRDYENDLQDRIRQLESSNGELERFAFVASHDLQEPLRKIQSFGVLLTQRYQPALDEDGILFLSKMMQSAERMSKLIKDLLNFSRLTTQADEVKPVRVADIIQEILNDQELRIQGQSAQVQVGRMPVIQGVSGQISHLFTNLIANALKFTRPGITPVIQIRAEAIDGSLLPELIPDRKYYRFTITDNGIGFDEKYTDHIFKVFQRLHGKEAYEGTGIGLAICKKVVMNHNGYITAQSTLGEGATFIVVLPEKQTSDFYDRATPDQTHSYTAG